MNCFLGVFVSRHVILRFTGKHLSFQLIPRSFLTSFLPVHGLAFYTCSATFIVQHKIWQNPWIVFVKLRFYGIQLCSSCSINKSLLIKKMLNAFLIHKVFMDYSFRSCIICVHKAMQICEEALLVSTDPIVTSLGSYLVVYIIGHFY